MSPAVKPRRTYNSPLRSEQAKATRDRVMAAAQQLFVESGYGATTVAAVASAAGVSAETIYTALGGKRGLLDGVAAAAIRDPADPEVQRRWWDEVARLSAHRERLRRCVQYSCSILARTYAVHAVIRGAADGDAFAGELRGRLLAERLAAQTDRVRQYLSGALRPGLSVEEAGQRYAALVSPELYYLLTVDLGWSPDQHRSWLTAVLEHELLAPAVR